MSSSTSNLSGKTFLSIEESLKAYNNDSISTVFIDGSWYLSPEQDGRKDYEKGPRIKEAVFFDIDEVASKGELNPKDLPHMMPSKGLFEAVMGSLGIKNSDHLIIYGSQGSRTFITMQTMGHPRDKVHLMQGSVQEWIDHGGPIESAFKEALKVDQLSDDEHFDYTASSAQNIVSMKDVTEVVEQGKESDTIIIDARPAARFEGKAPEPRPHVRRGNIPNSFNVPLSLLLEDVTKFKSADDMKTVFEDAGVDINTDKRIICTCGSGVTACGLSVALQRLGRDPLSTYVYDGSWLEWATSSD